MDPLAGRGPVELVAEGFVFLEGPAWDEGEGALYFTDSRADRIHRLSPPSAIEVVREPTGQANGLAVDAEGSLIVCEGSARRVTRMLDEGALEVVADSYRGSRFNSPNDVAVRVDGTVYFTDPVFAVGVERDLPFFGLFRASPGGEVTAEWEADDRHRPNGVILSPDETVLFVADTATAEILSFDVAPDGSLSGRRVFATGELFPDGMTVDGHWNLYVATSVGIEVWAPDGTRWGAIEIDRIPANCALGGSSGATLFVTAREGLYRVDLPAAAL